MVLKIYAIIAQYFNLNKIIYEVILIPPPRTT